MSKAPTEKQIAFANLLASLLELDFPQSSKDFTRTKYQTFIQQNIEAYRQEISNILEFTIDEDDL